MLVVAFMFCHRDWLKASRLARLLADLERRRRDDVTLLFVRATDFRENPVMDAAIARCAEVFRVENLIIRPDKPSRLAQWGNLGNWIEGSNIVWSGAVEHVVRNMAPEWSTVFFADGGDGAPVHRDWADILLEDHGRTEAQGLQVTGALRECRGIKHVNGNVVMSRSYLCEHPEFQEVPSQCQEYDVQYVDTFMPAARVSSLIYCGWHQFGADPFQFAAAGEHSVWWHGCKDGDFVDKARAHLFGLERPRPQLVDLGRAVTAEVDERFSPGGHSS